MSASPCNVINIRVNNLRPIYNNLKEWCEANNNHVYIGRRSIVWIDGVKYPPRNSIWSNPFKVGEDQNGDIDTVLECYRRHMIRLIEDGKITIEQLLSLKGKILGCWCKPDKCHGDVLIELIKIYDK